MLSRRGVPHDPVRDARAVSNSLEPASQGLRVHARVRRHHRQLADRYSIVVGTDMMLVAMQVRARDCAVKSMFTTMYINYWLEPAQRHGIC
jgi:hypothetical protein